MDHSATDRVIMSDRLDAYFCMDAFFVTKRSTKLTIGDACFQLFATGKCFARAELLSKISDLICALKSYVKKVGV